MPPRVPVYRLLRPGAVTRYTNDTIGNRPAASAYGPGWYFASDQNGGTLYHSDGATWQQQTAGLNWASGTQLAYAQDGALNFDVKAAGVTQADLSTPLRFTIPASLVPVAVRAKVMGTCVTGTAAAATVAEPRLVLTDNAGTMLDFDFKTVVQATAATQTYKKSFYVETILPAPVASGTYKLQGRLLAAAPANWGAIQFVGGSGVWPVAWMEAVAH